jgi:hypothetical protein
MACKGSDRRRDELLSVEVFTTLLEVHALVEAWRSSHNTDPDPHSHSDGPTTGSG